MKDKLKNIFHNSYPRIDIFISGVLTPIFSEDSIEGKNVNLIISKEIKNGQTMQIFLGSFGGVAKMGHKLR